MNAMLLQPIPAIATRKRARPDDATLNYTASSCIDSTLDPMRRLCLAASSSSNSLSSSPTTTDLPPLRPEAWLRPTQLPSLSEMLQPPSFSSRVVTSMAVLPQGMSMPPPRLEEQCLYTSSSEDIPRPVPMLPRTPDEYEVVLGQEPEDKTPWPTATEYAHLLSNMSAYSDIPVYDLGEDPRGVPLHPAFIYTQPRSCMYFLRCHRLLGRGSFGFPRQRTMTTQVGPHMCSKAFEWRKMSFVTGCPKKKPVVRYITATCYSRGTSSKAPPTAEKKEKKKMLRMHAVMLANEDGSGECGDFVLVHIRTGGCKRVGARMVPHPSSPVASPSPSFPEAVCASSPPPNKMRQFEASEAPFLLRKPLEPLWLSPPSNDSETPSSQCLEL